MTPYIRLWLVVTVAVVAWSSTPTALADPAAEARFFDRLARQQLAARHYDRALALFLQSQRAAPSPGALYNVAVAALLADEEALAYAHFEEFLASDSTDVPHREEAARRMAQMEAHLCRVHVESSPPGATITVDREELGSLGRTPRTIVVEPGRHLLHLSLTGHLPSSAEIGATVGELENVELSLEPILGTIALDVTPPSARVTARAADGSSIVADGTELRLPVGHHVVRIEAAGHVAVEREVLVTETATPLRVALEPAPLLEGRLLVDTGRVTARLLVDGTPRTTTPARLSLAEGSHTLRVEAEGHRPWEGAIEIVEGHARFLDLVLVPER